MTRPKKKESLPQPKEKKADLLSDVVIAPRFRWAPRRRSTLFLGFCASVVLAMFAGHRGAPLLGDELGETLGKLMAPPRRHVRELSGGSRGEADGLVTNEQGVMTPHASLSIVPPGDGTRMETEPDGGAPSRPARERGIYVPGSVVLGYAQRGVIPAADTAKGVVLRGVPAGSGLQDGDVVVRIGRAPVHSVREISSIVSASLFAGHSHVSGTVRRGEEEIAVTVEIPTGADAAVP